MSEVFDVANMAPTIQVTQGEEDTLATYTGPLAWPFSGVRFYDQEDDALTLTVSFDLDNGDLVFPDGVQFERVESEGLVTYTITGKANDLAALIQGTAFDPNDVKNGSGASETMFTLGLRDDDNEAVTNSTVKISFTDGGPSHEAPTISVMPGLEVTNAGYLGRDVQPFRGVTLDDADDDMLTLLISFDPTLGSITLPWGTSFWYEENGLRIYRLWGQKDYLTSILQNVTFDPNDDLEGSGPIDALFTLTVRDDWQGTPTTRTITVAMDDGLPPNVPPEIDVVDGTETTTTTYTDPYNVLPFLGVRIFDDGDELTCRISYDDTYGDLILPPFVEAISRIDEVTGEYYYVFQGTASELMDILSMTEFDPRDEMSGSGRTVTTFTIRVSDDDDNPVWNDEVSVVLDDDSVPNEAPSNLTLSNAVVDESGAAVIVGLLNAEDPDGDVLTYLLVDEDGNEITDSSPFEIQTVRVGADGEVVHRLATKAGMQVTEDTSYDVYVQVSDGRGGSVTEKFTVTIKNVVSANSAPVITVADELATTLATDTGENVHPFAGVSFDDAEDDILTVAITFDPAGGDLVLPAGMEVAPSVDAETGLVTYTFNGGKAAMAALMDSLAFDPSRQSASSGTITTTFTISVQDSTHPAVTNEEVSVITTITDKNRAPGDLQLEGHPEGVTVAEDATEIGVLSAVDQDGDDIQWSFAQDGNPGGMFVIDGNRIKLAEGRAFDVDGPEGVKSYTIRVIARDGKGGENSKSFVVTISNVNDNAPADIRVGGEVALTIPESAQPGDLVGILSATDADGDAIVSYQLAEPSDFFEIVSEGGVWKVVLKAEVDYETLAQRHHLLRITATDGKNTSAVQEVAIDVTNVNDAPTNLDLTNRVVNESDAAIQIGILSAVDLDGDALTYILVDSEGQEVTDSSDFEIQAVRVNGVTTYRLATKAGIQVDADETRDVYVKAFDGKGGAVTEKFTITIKNVNHDPTGLMLSNTTIDESSSAVQIGTLSATDLDGDTLSYLLVNERGEEITDSSPFEIQAVRVNGGTTYRLATKTGIQVSADETRDVYIKVSDGHGGSVIEKFIITIRNVEASNQKPVIHVSEASAVTTTTDVSEPVKPFMGVSFDDAEDDDLTVTISFDPLDGDLVLPALLAFDVSVADGVKTYTFSGKKAYLAALMDAIAFDPVQQDANSGTVTTTFTISVKDALHDSTINRSVKVVTTITDKNNAPAGLSLDNAFVLENVAGGTVVGNLSASDLDESDTLTYILDDDRFYIDGTQLKVKDGAKLDYETAQSHQVTISVTDGSALASQTFTIRIGDVVETLKGTKKKDTLKGSIGADILKGGYGNDKLTGGAGQDVFVFNTKLGTAKSDRKVNFDTITDFKVVDDSIWLDNAVFKKLGKKGTESKPVQLNKKFFKIGDKAKDKNDYIIYNKKTGILSYDADGSGSKEAIEIAKLSKNLKLTYKDFFVV